MREIGSVIRLVRTQQEMTQGELAEKVGLSISYISLMERDRKNLPVKTIARVFKALNFPIVLAFYLTDTQSVEKDLGERLSYAVFKRFDKSRR